MIVAKPKPFEELVEMLRNFSRVLVAGCGTCVAVCLAGGEKEAGILATQLELVFRDRDFKSFAATVERQCDREFLALFRDHIRTGGRCAVARVRRRDPVPR